MKYELFAILTFRKEHYKTLIVYNDRFTEFNDILVSNDLELYNIYALFYRMMENNRIK